MIKGEEYDCRKVDIWSTGVILYTMICGHLPFESNNTEQLYRKILKGQY